ncbi:SRPBCC domain-containing protein [Pedococcus sp. KACC 23699]|uniref:SRPBCC domain-containing protein n=1 Tax=Pedococcus sp. KACC 23699 TaxID=3149228 RepID=A0AAU7JS35_9MICO
MKLIGSMRTLDETRGAVRVEDVYDTDIADLWEACTTPERLARWIAEVSGDLREGGSVHATFTSSWSGPARIEVCDAPHHLLVTAEPGSDDETQIEAWLTAEGARTRLVVEERGIPLAGLHFYGAGWQVHLEDLGRSLASGGPVHAEGWSPEAPARAWHARWTELTPEYVDTSVS